MHLLMLIQPDLASLQPVKARRHSSSPLFPNIDTIIPVLPHLPSSISSKTVHSAFEASLILNRPALTSLCVSVLFRNILITTCNVSSPAPHYYSLNRYANYIVAELSYLNIYMRGEVGHACSLNC